MESAEPGKVLSVIGYRYFWASLTLYSIKIDTGTENWHGYACAGSAREMPRGNQYKVRITNGVIRQSLEDVSALKRIRSATKCSGDKLTALE